MLPNSTQWLFTQEWLGLHICCKKTNTTSLSVHANSLSTYSCFSIIPGFPTILNFFLKDYLLPKRHGVILGRCGWEHGSDVWRREVQDEYNTVNQYWNPYGIQRTTDRYTQFKHQPSKRPHLLSLCYMISFFLVLIRLNVVYYFVNASDYHPQCTAQFFPINSVIFVLTGTYVQAQGNQMWGQWCIWYRHMSAFSLWCHDKRGSLLVCVHRGAVEK